MDEVDLYDDLDSSGVKSNGNTSTDSSGLASILQDSGDYTNIAGKATSQMPANQVPVNNPSKLSNTQQNAMQINTINQQNPQQQQMRMQMQQQQMFIPEDNTPTTVSIGQVQWWTSDKEIEELLSEFGAVNKIKYFEDKANGKFRGFFQAEFTSRKSALACIQGLNGRNYAGNQLKASLEGTKDSKDSNRPQYHQKKNDRHNPYQRNNNNNNNNNNNRNAQQDLMNFAQTSFFPGRGRGRGMPNMNNNTNNNNNNNNNNRNKNFRATPAVNGAFPFPQAYPYPAHMMAAFAAPHVNPTFFDPTNAEAMFAAGAFPNVGAVGGGDNANNFGYNSRGGSNRSKDDYNDYSKDKHSRRERRSKDDRRDRDRRKSRDSRDSRDRSSRKSSRR